MKNRRRNELSPVFRPVVEGIVLRDFSDIRVLPGSSVPVRAGAVTATNSENDALKKLHYVILLGNLAAITGFLGNTPDAWHAIRTGLAGIADDIFLAPTLEKKAFLAMNVADSGDQYVTVPNPFTHPE